ncbi:hypothetical protein GYMLUDRAFT_797010 [Collybiopsis luxurians FD-317 M1]|nr:hypothetical protein GYMLUDRAFT_797010 [Collybiopsis luxurians FD-317 M1]
MRQSLSVPIPTPKQLAAGTLAVDRSSVAALAFLVYDIMLTVHEEVDIIWPRPWSLMKFNYFFIRYLPVLFQIPLLLVGTELSPQFHFTNHACFIWEIYQGAASISTTIGVDYILISRVYAFYFDNRAVRWIVSISFALEICIMCVGLALTLPGIRYDPICLNVDVPITLLVYAAGTILFQALLFVFTVFKFILAIRSGWGRVPIVLLLMRDGTWAFFVIFAVLVCNASLYGLKNTAFAGILYSWVLTIYSFCGYRVLLNIGHLTNNEIRTSTTLTIQFTQNDEVELYEMSSLPLGGT